ncbi:YciI family protein [Micromonospora sp. NPDC005979]|uniref:YciI family protein n=1 Tax=Micromonospora sp. NPDC005979 TaxID=3156726 RepID=UPI0033A993FA
MKYMLLMQFSATGTDFPGIDTWTQDEVRAHVGFMREVNEKLVADGEWVDAQGLGGPQQARIVRADEGGAPVVTEGPFAETKEFLAGFWIVDLDSRQRAVELAAHISTAPGPGGRPLNMPIEVHPVMSAPSQEL